MVISDMHGDAPDQGIWFPLLDERGNQDDRITGEVLLQFDVLEPDWSSQVARRHLMAAGRTPPMRPSVRTMSGMVENTVVRVWVQGAVNVKTLDEPEGYPCMVVVQSGDTSRRTRVSQRTPAPQWNEKFDLVLRANDPIIKMTLIKWAAFGAREQVMGTTIIPLTMLGHEMLLDQWYIPRDEEQRSHLPGSPEDIQDNLLSMHLSLRWYRNLHGEVKQEEEDAGEDFEHDDDFDTEQKKLKLQQDQVQWKNQSLNAGLGLDVEIMGRSASVLAWGEELNEKDFHGLVMSYAQMKTLMEGSVIFVDVVEAKDMNAIDPGSPTNPFVVADIPELNLSWKTKVKKNTLRPKWAESHMFNLAQACKKLEFKVFDFDMRNAHRCLGEVQIDVRTLADQDLHDEWIPLQKPTDVTNYNHRVRGKLHLRVRWIPVRFYNSVMVEDGEGKPVKGKDNIKANLMKRFEHLGGGADSRSMRDLLAAFKSLHDQNEKQKLAHQSEVKELVKVIQELTEMFEREKTSMELHLATMHQEMRVLQSSIEDQKDSHAHEMEHILEEGEKQRIYYQNLAVESQQAYLNSMNDVKKIAQDFSDSLPLLRWVEFRRFRTCDYILKGHTEAVRALVEFKDKLLSAGMDNTIRIWYKVGWRLHKTRAAHDAPVLCLLVCKFTDVLVTGSMDSTIRVWDLSSFICQRVLGGEGKVHITALAEAGDCVAAGRNDNTVQIWRQTTWQLAHILRRHTGVINCLMPFQKYLFTGSADSTVRIWNTEKVSNDQLRAMGEVIQLKKKVSALSESSSHLDESEWVCERILRGHVQGVTALAISEKNRQLVTGCQDGSIKVWSLETWEILHTFIEHSAPVSMILVAASRIVTCSLDSTIKHWDTETFTCEFTVFGHEGPVHDLIFVGDSLASASADNTIRIWN
eukprot:GILJ01013947.1.p1 GENE.GILJ01013947.1~~GILJ01013947.1.p1  ORF type:complete len:1059 (+),score=141.64 GILJ01013947.1:436-3177(+)